MASFFKDNDDLLYYFERGLDWGALIDATERGPSPQPKAEDAAKIKAPLTIPADPDD